MPMNAEQTVFLSYIKDLIEREQSRKDAAFRRLAMLKDDFTEAAKEHVKKCVTKEESKKYLSSIIVDVVNVFATIIDEISLVYNEKPYRSWQGNPADIEIMQVIFDKIKINQLMKKVNRYTNAANTTLLQVVWRADKLGNEGIDVDILTPNVVTIDPRSDNPTLPELVAIDKTYIDSAGKKGTKRLTVVWTDDEHFAVDENGVLKPINEENENPYGVLPFVYVHRELPDNFWDETSGDDIYNCTLEVAAMLTLIKMLFIWNSFKQLAINTQEKPSVLPHSPDTVIHLSGPDDKAEVLDFEVDIKEKYESVKELMVLVFYKYGIDPSGFTLKRVEESGKAGKVKSHRLLKRWRDQIPIYEDVEKDLVDMIKIVYEKHTGKKLKADLKTEFPYQEVEVEEKDVIANIRDQVETNLMDYVMAFMELNKGFRNYEEAKEKVMEIINTNNELKEMVKDPIDTILGQTAKQEA